MAMKNVLKQPEKNAQRDPLKRDGLAITVERRGTSSGIPLRHPSGPRLHVRSARTTLEERLPPEA